MMSGYPAGPPSSSMICQSVENPDMDMYHSRGVGTGMDDESSSVAEGNGSSKDKGRGSYKCGRVSSNSERLNVLFSVSRLTQLWLGLYRGAVWCSEKGSCMSLPAEIDSSTRGATS